MFRSRIGWKSLSVASRSLSTLLDSGVDVVRAFELAAGKTGDVQCRQAMRETADALRRGEDVTSAFRAQGERFPDLFVNLVSIGEQTGALPEVLRSLAEHYENNLRLRKYFLMAVAWPAFQFVVAVLIVALVLVILGWIAESQGGEALDVFGLGLTGVSGAVIWLTCTFGSVAVLLVAYQVISRGLQGKRVLHALLLQVPVVGYCMRSFAIARFSWAFALTQQCGMPIQPSLEASLRATGNGVFLAAFPEIWQRVSGGQHLSDALDAAGLFPDDFIHIVQVAETSGTVPEELARLSPQFEDQARRSLTAMVSTLAWVIWALVAAIIIFLVISVVLWYVSLINEFMPR